ncbi:hypothetical protein I315_00933 [Cryptococcus gattii Ru294]|nr:hypothetical protein I315_00933 [Cryptococcus gattii Ru294]
MSTPPVTSPTASAHADSRQQHGDDNPSLTWSGKNIKASDGYSALFTSGLFHESPTKPFGPQSQSKLSPTTPDRRHRRSSIIHATPSTSSPRIIKSQGLDGGVERALDTVMRSLKTMAMGTSSRKMDSPPLNQSRWSAWSSDSEGSKSMSRSCTPASGQQNDEYRDGDDGFFKPRKSSDTTRSKNTIRSIKSTKSSKSRKGRKSEETVSRMEMYGKGVPAVPTMTLIAVSTTPGRSRRMINGLVKRLGLTPRKNKSSLPPAQLPPNLPSPLPPAPVHASEDHTIPRKASLSTLRSVLTKKESSITLRSIRSIRSCNNASMTLNHVSTDDHPLPLPLPRPHREAPANSPRTTPGKGRRTPKISIGQPKLQLETSPSAFLRGMPRRAPDTPKHELFALDREGCQDKDTPEVLAGSSRVGQGMWFGDENGEDIVMADEMMQTVEIFTPPPAPLPATTVRAPASHPIVSSVSTPSSQPCLGPQLSPLKIQGSIKSIESPSLPFSPVSLSSRLALASTSASTFTTAPTSFSILPASFTGSSPCPVPSALDEIVPRENTTLIRSAKTRRDTDGQGKGQAVDGRGKNRLLDSLIPPLGSPLNFGHGMGAPRKLRTAKASLTPGNLMAMGIPLSSKDTNALGLPVPSYPSLDGITSVKSKVGKMSTLSVISRLSKPSGGGASPAPQLRMQNQSQNRPPLGKMSLGTVTSYYDAHTVKERERDKSSPPPFCGEDNHTYTRSISVDPSGRKFEDPLAPSIFNPKHSPSPSSMSDCSLGSLFSKGGDSIVTGETGATSSTDEVEKWELERYLNVLEGQSVNIRRRAGYI